MHNHVPDHTPTCPAAAPFPRSDKVSGKTLTLAGPKAWTTKEVIELCDKMADTNAKVGSINKRRKGSPGAETH